MTLYKSWEALMEASPSFLDLSPIGLRIDKGIVSFYLEYNDKLYYCSGSECVMSDLYFNSQDTIRTQVDFEYFTMSESGNPDNKICEW